MSISVDLPKSDWEQVIHGLTMLRDNELSYLDDVIDKIDKQVE
jgi:hypothetical protein